MQEMHPPIQTETQSLKAYKLLCTMVPDLRRRQHIIRSGHDSTEPWIHAFRRRFAFKAHRSGIPVSGIATCLEVKESFITKLMDLD